MGYEPFDGSKHRRDLLGHFTTGDGPAVMRFRMGGVARMRATRRPSANSARIAEPVRLHEGAARRRLSRYMDRRSHVWLATPRGQRGAALKADGVRRPGRVPRESTMRTVNGKAIVVRGFGKPYIDKNEYLRYLGPRLRPTNRAGMAHRPTRSITPRAMSAGRHRA